MDELLFRELKELPLDDTTELLTKELDTFDDNEPLATELLFAELELMGDDDTAVLLATELPVTVPTMPLLESELRLREDALDRVLPLDELTTLLTDDEEIGALLPTELLTIELLFDELIKLLLEENAEELPGVEVGDGVESPPPPPQADIATVRQDSR